VVNDSAELTPATGNASPRQALRRRRGRIAILVVVSVIVVLGIAAAIAETVARQQAQSLIAEQLRSSLQLAPEHPVDVSLGGGSVLVQGLAGRLALVEVQIEDVTFGELVGDLSVTVRNTPIDASQPTESVQAVYEVAEGDVAALTGFLSGTTVNDVRLDEREIRFQTAFTFFGVEFAVGVGVTPSVQDGQLAFTPSSVVLNDERIDASDLREQFGQIVEPLLASQQFCVAQYLPADLALSAVQVGDEQLTVVFGAINVALAGAGFSTLGTCP
jgi:hypothetical protein